MGNKTNKTNINPQGNQINNNPPTKVIVGIDFGTSGIAYAFSFLNNQKQIFLSDFEGQSADKKIPTEIILDNEFNEVLAFGHECSGYIKCHHQKNSYEYFKDIKMNLYRKIYKIKSTNGKEADIEIIILKILKKISMEAIVQIQKDHDEELQKKALNVLLQFLQFGKKKASKLL